MYPKREASSQEKKKTMPLIIPGLWPEREDMDLDDVYFQQDGVTCHTSSETFGLLREKFPGRVVSRNGNHNWPP